MRRHALALAACFLTTPALAQDPPARKAPKGQAWEQDEYEERVIKQAVERAAKQADSEPARWKREMDKTFPDRAPAPQTEDDLEKWFALLAGGGKEWRRDDSANRQVAELFDRVAQKLDLGPVPAVRKDEFLQFGRKLLLPRNRDGAKAADFSAEADRVFRVLDRDRSGVIEQAEWTDRHRADSRKADADGDREIDQKEYRAYFEARVAEGVEAAGKPTKPAPTGAAAAKAGLPGWFKDYDTDADGQVDLAEWRAAGRPFAEFLELDLNGDGLLPPDEYLRYLRAAREKPPATVPVGKKGKP